MDYEEGLDAGQEYQEYKRLEKDFNNDEEWNTSGSMTDSQNINNIQPNPEISLEKVDGFQKQNNNDVQSNPLISAQKNEKSMNNGSQMKEKQHKLYCYRYLIGVLFSYNLFVKNFALASFSTYGDLLKQAYDIDIVSFQSITYITMMAYITLNFPLNAWIAQGTYGPICTAVILVVVGSWIRVLINQWFYWTIVGQALVGIGQVLLLNSMVNLSNDWFSPRERVIMTSVFNTFNFSGVFAGFLIPNIWIDTSNTTDMALAREQIQNTMFYLAIIFSPSLITLFLQKNKPEQPPSFTAGENRVPFKKSIQDICTNMNFHLINANFLIINAVYNVFFINIDLITEKYDEFDQSDSILFGCIFIGSGCVGCLISGYFLSKKPKFKILIVLTALIHFLAYLAFVLTLQYYQNKIVTSIQIGIIGFVNIAVQPISLEFAAEATYPVSETYSGGILFTSSQVLSIILSVLIGQLMNITEISIAQSPGLIVSFISFIITLFIKEDLRRLKSDINLDENKTEILDKDTEPVESESMNNIAGDQNLDTTDEQFGDY